ncbi:MAG: MarR family transcriptional regulator [Clostridia bacterium]|nr:MarR family transcriptional regulator [Clostridia bacterium]
MPSISRYINVISRCGSMYRSERLKDTDLGTTHHTYLLTICRNPGISQEQLARKIYINKSNVTRNLAVLEKNGYIERRPSETDKRVMLVYPTEKAENTLPLLREIIHDWNTLVAEDFTEEELEQLRSMLARIAERATGYADGTEFD